MAAPKPIRSQSYEQVYELVRSAIAAKQPITAVYRDRRRLLCPYLLGRNRDGRIQALCYQSSDDPKRRGSADNWRCVEVEKLTDVSLSDERWLKAPNYSRHQTCIETVEAEIQLDQKAGV